MFRSRRSRILISAQVGMLEAVDQLADNPPDEDEVQRAIPNSLTNGIERNAQRFQPGSASSCPNGRLPATWRLMFLHRDRIEQVSTDDVAPRGGHLPQARQPHPGSFHSRRRPADAARFPDAPELGPLLADYTGRDDRAAGEAFDPTPDNIAERLIEFELANGTRVALLPKQTRGEKVVGNVTLRMGQSRQPVRSGRKSPERCHPCCMRGSEKPLAPGNQGPTPGGSTNCAPA